MGNFGGGMRFEVGAHLREAVGSEHVYDLDEMLDLGGGESLPVQGKVKMVKTGRGLLVIADLEARKGSVCHRCLASIDLSLPFHLEEEFLPTADPIRGGRLPPPPDPDIFTIDEHQVLDLSEVLRQYVLLAAPMKSLCQPECRGLCPRCGQNLNLGPCSCPPQ